MSFKRDKYSYNIDYDPDKDIPEDTSIDDIQYNTGEERLDTKQTESKKERKWPGFIRFFIDRRTHAFIGVLLILFSAYLAMASLSYISSAADDQSKLNELSIDEMVSEPVAITNVTGPVGAIAAHLLLTHGLGIGSLVLVVYLFMLGIYLIGLKKKLFFWNLTLKCLFTAIAVSIIAGLADIYLNSERVYPLGGYHGRFVDLWLIDRIQWIGMICTALALATALALIYLYDVIKLSRRVRDAYRVAFPARQHHEINTDETSAEAESLTNENSAYMPSEETGGLTENSNTDVHPEMIPVSVNFCDDMPDDAEKNEGKDTIPMVIMNTTITTETEEKTEPEKISSLDATEFPEIKTVYDPEDENATESALDQDALETNDDKNDIPDEVASEESKAEVTDFSITTNEIEEGEEDTSKLYDPTAELSRYQRPTLDLLVNRGNKSTAINPAEQEENKERIIKTLKDYGIGISKIEATIGPTVTLYEIIPAEGIRIAKIKRLEDDIALSLAALGIRIIAPIPGKGTIGIEVPNKTQQTVSMRSILGSKAFQECNYQLPMAMGATISNDIYIADLAKMPHLLVAGATGQGKSVGLNAIIASLLYKKHPSELKFVLVDPKMVEFSLYARLRNHFLAQLEGEDDAVITDPEKVERTLNSLCVEMDNRYNLLKDAGVRSLLEYNEKFAQRRLNPEKGHRYLPYIVIIVDEFADLIMTSGKAIETPIARIAQKARAVGMHMIIATQRPSANVITGIIRANFPGRIAFKVFSMVDSKVILDRSGANQLIGRGDMLFSHNGSMDRVQCAFIDTPEVDAIVETISSQPGFAHPYYLPEPPTPDSEITIGSITDRDPLFEDAAQFLCAGGDTASTSSLQRKFSIGYNRAGKIMDQLESAGIVSAAQGSKPRNVLVDLFQLDSILSSNRHP